MDREQALGTVLNVLADWGSRVAVADRPRLAAYIVDALTQAAEATDGVHEAAQQVVAADQAWLGNENADTRLAFRLAMARLRAALDAPDDGRCAQRGRQR